MGVRMMVLSAILAGVCVAVSAAPQQPRAAHGRLFPPEKLGELEGPDRDEWQQPERIMDALAIADGSRVGDIGAGGGWFTVRLARRVGPNGRVFAEDIQRQMIESIQRRVAREGLRNVDPILGTPRDPRLPADLDAVLIVDTYPQLDDPVGLMTMSAVRSRPADGSASWTSRKTSSAPVPISTNGSNRKSSFAMPNAPA